jgi:hypothetical protein
LVSRESLVLEAGILLDHFVEDLVAFLGDAQGRLFVFGDGFVVLALEEDAIRQEDLDEVDRKDKSEIPLEKLHQHSLCFDDVRITGALRGILRQPLVVSLDIIYENEVVVDLIVLGGYQETSRQQDCDSSRGQLSCSLGSLSSLVKKVSVQEFDCDVGRFGSLSELLAHLKQSFD